MQISHCHSGHRSRVHLSPPWLGALLGLTLLSLAGGVARAEGGAPSFVGDPDVALREKLQGADLSPFSPALPETPGMKPAEVETMVRTMAEAEDSPFRKVVREELRQALVDLRRQDASQIQAAGAPDVALSASGGPMKEGSAANEGSLAVAAEEEPLMMIGCLNGMTIYANTKREVMRPAANGECP